jgi:hypothetical protein
MDDQRVSGKRRLRFRLSIRDLFWLTLVAVLVVGWWLDHRVLAPKAALTDRAIKAIAAQKETINKLIGSNQYVEKQFQRARTALWMLRDYDPRLVDAATEVAHDINSFSPLPEHKPQWQQGHNKNYGPYGFQEFSDSP